MEEFLGIAGFLLVGCALVPMFVDAVFFSSFSLMPLLVTGAVIAAIWNVCNGLS